LPPIVAEKKKGDGRNQNTSGGQSIGTVGEIDPIGCPGQYQEGQGKEKNGRQMAKDGPGNGRQPDLVEGMVMGGITQFYQSQKNCGDAKLDNESLFPGNSPAISVKDFRKIIGEADSSKGGENKKGKRGEPIIPGP
jgi:hypothetical protein